jgi:hypothetical protein
VNNVGELALGRTAEGGCPHIGFQELAANPTMAVLTK